MLTASNLPLGSKCKTRARAVNLTDSTAGPFSFEFPVLAASVPVFYPSSLTLESIALGTVLVTWRPAVGANGYILDMDAWDGNWKFLLQTGEVSPLWSGNASTTIPQTLNNFVVAKLDPGSSLRFRIRAFNQVGPSLPFYSGVSLSPDPSTDPTTAQLSGMTFVSGSTQPVTIHARHPRTRALQTLGGNCTVVENSACIPGRSFICSFYGRSPVVAEDLNDGRFVLRCPSPKAGSGRSLAIEALWPGLLAEFWDNSIFFGSSVDLRTTTALSFDWGNGPVTRWNKDGVSVRFRGFLKPDYTDEYTLYCQAETGCKVMLEGVTVVDWSESFSPGLPLIAGQLYPLVVEYYTESGNSTVSLSWASAYWQPKAVVPEGNLFRGSNIVGSPFVVDVINGLPVGNKSVAYGLRESEVFVQTRDAGGSDCVFGSGYDEVVAKFLLAGQGTTRSFIGKPDGDTGGIYRIRFALPSGTYLVIIQVNGEEVQNSPMGLRVR